MVPFRHASAKTATFSLPQLAKITFLLLGPNSGPYLDETLLRKVKRGGMPYRASSKLARSHYLFWTGFTPALSPIESEYFLDGQAY